MPLPKINDLVSEIKDDLAAIEQSDPVKAVLHKIEQLAKWLREHGAEPGSHDPWQKGD